ncbi:hypothetical protein AMJ40_05005 [candidate division TA06 bacterium DG_26]|uniref:Peptidase S49 domain-containing protein n=1 Tax=candidate division TA06 bacterium DG_26 TaxID=1703771 RepID=A0A0S7WHP1_UNCT6|nr:MAG: hypothetical protein AMJ40_05005 [candidate division TA06 bacterium DG_26]
MDRKLIAIVVAVVGIILVGSFFIILALLKESGGLLPMKGAVALVEIEGVMHSSEGVISEIEEYRKSESVGAIVIRIDSPGGGVVVANEIFKEIQRARQDGKPVVVSMGSVAASGGYYVACAADKIVANPGTVTGSIGVIMGFPNLEELLRKVGVKFETIKSGRYKDTGSPVRQMRDDEREMLEEVVEDVWEQFVGVVSEQRNLPLEEVEEIADGRILTGNRAKELGLIDQFGTLHDAIMLAAELAEIEGEPRIVKKRRVFRLLDLLGEFFVRVSRSDSPFSLEYRMTMP